jgi:hypothetical protein
VIVEQIVRRHLPSFFRARVERCPGRSRLPPPGTRCDMLLRATTSRHATGEDASLSGSPSIAKMVADAFLRLYRDVSDWTPSLHVVPERLAARAELLLR